MDHRPRSTDRIRLVSAFVAAALSALSMAIVTALPAGAAELSAGDVLVTDTFPDTLFTVNPATGAKTSVSAGGLGGVLDVGLGGQIFAIDPDTKELIRVEPSSGDQTVIVGGFDYIDDLAVEHGGDVLVVDGTRLIRVDVATSAKTVLLDFTGSGLDPEAVTVEVDGDIILGSMSGVTVYLHRIDPVSGAEELLFSDVCPVTIPRGCITNLWDIAAAPDGDIALLDPGRGVFRWDASAGDLTFLGGRFGGNMEGLAVEPDGDVLFGYFSFSDGDFSGLYRIERDAPGVERKLAGFDRPVGVAVVPEIDTRTPSVFFGTPADGDAFQPGEVVLASYACFDGGSGIASCVGDVAHGTPIDTSSVPASKSFTVTATDNAGNRTATTHQYLIDGTPPTIAITTPPEGAVYQQGQIVVSEYSCDDSLRGFAGSGIATCISTSTDEIQHVQTSTPGPHAFTVTASDRAGNTATLTHNYTVDGNDPPLAIDQAVSTLEDTPVAFTLGGSDPDGDTLTFSIDAAPTHGSLTGEGPGVTYTPATDSNGADGLTYSVDDGAGGTATATVTIQVSPVNDAPSFAPGSNVSVDEDSGPYAASWATAISAGPPDEVDQTRAFDVTATSNLALFSSAPTVAPDGTLIFTPAPNANGVATVTVELRDDGGTENGGANTSAPSSFTITVNSVNDVPTVAITGGQCLSETSASGRVNLTITDIESGPGSMTVSATSGTQALLPNSRLSTGGNGANRTVTLTAAPNMQGTALVIIEVSDGTDSTTVALTVVVGTAADERIAGTSGDDVLFGLAGVDTLRGEAGRDLLCGGNGIDTLIGGGGDDVLDGGRANDVLDGSAGNDRLFGKEGNDTLTGGPGADFLSGGPGADTATDLSRVEGDTQDGTIP